MSILKVARMGHPVLREKARPIDRGQIKSARIQQLIDDLMETMAEYHGVGLAAPQVHEGVRIFIATLDVADVSTAGVRPDAAARDDEKSESIAIINPEITPVGGGIVEDWEGCLSIPDIRGRVPRAKDITVRGFDRTGARIDLLLHDYSARVVQHETDHLDGVLFFDRMRSFESLTFLDEYSRYWINED
jgi:peptide deformylase